MPASTHTIAIVEDDESFNRALERLLKASGFATQTFLSAEEFLANDAFESLACLILDINLPGISGFELFDRLSLYDERPPIIFITATDEKTVRDHASRISGNVCLGKPLVGAALLRAVRAQVRRSESGRD
ncbi:MAG: response regulator [Verrucomicrobia bacterium]|nr:response regulator [Verrucomicrobiota bacterium]